MNHVYVVLLTTNAGLEDVVGVTSSELKAEYIIDDFLSTCKPHNRVWPLKSDFEVKEWEVT